MDESAFPTFFHRGTQNFVNDFSLSILIPLYFLDMFSLIFLSRNHTTNQNFKINMTSLLLCYHLITVIQRLMKMLQKSANLPFFASSTYTHLRVITQREEMLDLNGCCTMSYQSISFNFAKFDSTKTFSVCHYLPRYSSNLRN